MAWLIDDMRWEKGRMDMPYCCAAELLIGLWEGPYLHTKNKTTFSIVPDSKRKAVTELKKIGFVEVLRFPGAHYRDCGSDTGRRYNLIVLAKGPDDVEDALIFPDGRATPKRKKPPLMQRLKAKRPPKKDKK